MLKKQEKKQNNRCISMTAKEERLLAEKAQAERSSFSSYVVKAALDKAQRKDEL